MIIAYLGRRLGRCQSKPVKFVEIIRKLVMWLLVQILPATQVYNSCSEWSETINVLSPLLFNFALECAFSMSKATKDPEIDWSTSAPVLGKKRNTVKKKNRNLLISSRKLVQNGGYHVFSLAYQ
jgi:hypothetical protein